MEGSLRPPCILSTLASANMIFLILYLLIQVFVPHQLALNCLHILGALDQVDKVAILKSISKCQREDGSFSSFENTFEADLRFVYSALSVCKLLGDFSFIDTNKAK